MSSEDSKEIIQKFYKFFNEVKLDQLFDLIAEDIVHEFNYQENYGKAAFIKFMEYSVHHYDEQVDNVIYMVSDNGRQVTTKFTTHGKYKTTDSTLIPAHNQQYTIAVVNYFEIDEGKIIRANCYFNENEIIKQLGATAEEVQ
jgi:steroid delta-isomerase-like uncharacterized protein